MKIDISNNNFDNVCIEEAQLIYKMALQNELLSKYKFPSHPSSDGIYRIWVKDSSKKTGRRQLSSKSLDDLKSKVLEFERRNITPNSKYTFRELFEYIEEERLDCVKGEKKLSRINTVSVERSNFNSYFSNAPFVNTFIDDITTMDIENYTRELLKTTNIRDKAYSNYQGLLRLIFTKAKKKKLIATNIFYDIEFDLFEGLIVDSTPIKERMHPQDEFLTILEEARAFQTKYPKRMTGYALELQMVMARRLGEVTPLMRSDVKETYIELSKQQIYVREPGNKRWEIKHKTKNKKDYYYPRFNEVNIILEKIFKVLDMYYPDSEYLFPSSYPDSRLGIVTSKGVYELYARICKKHGYKLSRDCIKGTHSFRRNASTDILNISNGNTRMEEEIMGHTSTVASKCYDTGCDIEKSIEVLNQRIFH